jgi:hypothetical protein
MPVKETIKILLAKENITLTELAKKLSKETNKTVKMDSLSQKLRKGTMKYEEVELLAKILDYQIIFEKLENESDK